MHLAYALRLIARKLPAVLLCALLGLGLGWLASRAMQTYTTTAYLAMSPAPDQLSVRAVDPERFFQTESQLILGDGVMNASAKALDDGTNPEDLRQLITLGGGATNDILQISVLGDSEEQSLQRTQAVLKGIRETKMNEISTRLLWTSAPSGSIDERQYLVGGLLGGALLGALGSVLWGAVRRPLIDPRFVQLDDERIQVYPRPVRPGVDTLSENDPLTSWLRAHNPHRLPWVVAQADADPATRAMADTLPSSAGGAVEDGRFLIYLASTGQKSTETGVDELHRAVAGPKDEAVLLMVNPKAAAPRTQDPAVRGRRAIASENADRA